MDEEDEDGVEGEEGDEDEEDDEDDLSCGRNYLFDKSYLVSGDKSDQMIKVIK